MRKTGKTAIASAIALVAALSLSTVRQRRDIRARLSPTLLPLRNSC
jgi:hypothetical protein